LEKIGLEQKYRVTVVGGGSFGTALANIISCNGSPTTLWMRDPEQVIACQSAGENVKYLPGYQLNQALEISSDLEASIRDRDIVVMATPSHSFRQVTRAAAIHFKSNAIVISATKGISSPGLTLMSDIDCRRVKKYLRYYFRYGECIRLWP